MHVEDLTKRGLNRDSIYPLKVNQVHYVAPFSISVLLNHEEGAQGNGETGDLVQVLGLSVSPLKLSQGSQLQVTENSTQTYLDIKRDYSGIPNIFL